ncbi:MAG TPA: hypothetical protein VH704_08635 [Casimicrobiaceae bacterium]|nr:hypothetical protein [Casimicrobiaceae bacterium]
MSYLTDSIMRRFPSLAVVVVSALLPTAAAYALDNVDPYICPTALHGSGTDCFFEAVAQTYTMCRQVKSIEIIEFGLAGAQVGTHGAKTEGCIEKHKRLIARPYQAALREAGRNMGKVHGLQKLYATWENDLAKLTPGPEEIDEGYKERVARVYGDLNEQIKALREPAVAAEAAPRATSKSAVAKKITPAQKAPGADKQ